MKIVTVVSDENNYGLHLLKLSCAVHALALDIVVSQKRDFTSMRLKDDVLRAYLSDKDDEEIVLFTDGYDAVFMSREEEILQKFKQTKKDLLFSAETNCWPDATLATKHPIASTPYRYLNSGGFIGKIGVIKEFMDDNTFDTNQFKNSNQHLWMNRFLNHSDRIGLDTTCEIFCTFSPEIGVEHLASDYTVQGNAMGRYYLFKNNWFEEQFTIENGRIFNKTTGTWPVQAHFNGESKVIIGKNIIDMLLHKLPGAAKIKTVRNTG